MLYVRIGVVLGGVVVEVLKAIVKVIYIVICILLTVIVLKQDKNSTGLSGALTGASETFWSKNRGRSTEGILEKMTKILTAVFIILSVVLNLEW